MFQFLPIWIFSSCFYANQELFELLNGIVQTHRHSDTSIISNKLLCPHIL